MRDIKFSYIQKDADGVIHEVIYTIDDLETGNIDRIILAQKETYGIIARRMFTGLKDSKGNDIYQKDIMRDEFGVLGYVEYRLPSCRYDLKTSDGWTDAPFWSFERSEVIGNIFENPELVEGNSNEL